MSFMLKMIKRLYEIIVIAMGLSITVFILTLSFRHTTFVTQAEKVMYSSDTPAVFWLALFIFAVLFVIIPKKNCEISVVKRINGDDEFYQSIVRALFLAIVIIGSVWVLSTQMIARSDQYEIQSAAFRMRMGDFGELKKDGYIGAYTNQMGLLFISYLMSFVFGNENSLFFQVVNCIAVGCIYCKLASITRRIGGSNLSGVLVMIFGVLFYPLILYTSYVYGNIIGLACSLGAIDREYVFFETHKVKDAAFSALLISLAVLFKSNFAIFAIGMFIFAIVEFVVKKNRRILCFILIGIVCLEISSCATRVCLRMISGVEIADGISPYSFVAMGLQESGLGPGRYNAYNNLSYELSGYDSDKQKQMAIWNIKDRINYFYENKDEAVGFFVKKLAGEWNEPTFESQIIISEKSKYADKISDWVWEIISVQGNYIANRYGKVLQVIVLVGTILFFLFVNKEQDLYKRTILLVIFIGGFIFHTLWEAKSQYTLLFFMLLVPYFACGGEFLSDCLIDGTIVFEVKKKRNISLIMLSSLVLVCTLIALYKNGDCLSFETEQYKEYYRNSLKETVVKDGVYKILRTDEDGIFVDKKEREKYSFDDDDISIDAIVSKSEISIQVINYHGRVRLYIPELNLYLQHYSNDIVKASKYSDSVEQLWLIKETDDEKRYMIIPCYEGIDIFDERLNVSSAHRLGIAADNKLVITENHSDTWLFNMIDAK